MIEPVIYVTNVIHLRNKLFKMNKFRTMCNKRPHELFYNNEIWTDNIDDVNCKRCLFNIGDIDE